MANNNDAANPAGFSGVGVFRNFITNDIKGNVLSTYKHDWSDKTIMPPSLEGTRYSRYGSRAEGMASLLDTEILKRNIDKERENLGDGFVELMIVDESKRSQPLNIGNRMHYANADGKIAIIDGKYLEIMKQREQERREYIEDIMQTAMMSDEICATLLGTNIAGLNAKLGGGVGAIYGITDEAIIKISALPSSIETYSEHSINYSNAIQKFKMCFKKYMPCIDTLTTNKNLNE
jgi:hypothetical protein